MYAEQFFASDNKDLFLNSIYECWVGSISPIYRVLGVNTYSSVTLQVSHFLPSTNFLPFLPFKRRKWRDFFKKICPATFTLNIEIATSGGVSPTANCWASDKNFMYYNLFLQIKRSLFQGFLHFLPNKKEKGKSLYHFMVFHVSKIGSLRHQRNPFLVWKLFSKTKLGAYR